MISFSAAISGLGKGWQWNSAFVTAGHLCHVLFDVKGLEAISFSAAISAYMGFSHASPVLDAIAEVGKCKDSPLKMISFSAAISACFHIHEEWPY
eukprot:6169695-Karenia_brevis.AAC.1